MSNLQRNTVEMVGLSLPSSLGTPPSLVIPTQNNAGGQVYIRNTSSSLTTITWYGAARADLAFTPCQDGAGNPSVSTVAPGSTGCNCKIPTDCFACAFLAPVGNVAETIDVNLKS